jgi:selenium metabolism protein YedF
MPFRKNSMGLPGSALSKTAMPVFQPKMPLPAFRQSYRIGLFKKTDRAAGLTGVKRNSEMKEIDTRGQACPAPVLMTKAAIENEKAQFLKIIADNKASKENVSVFLKSKHFEISVEEKDGNYIIYGKGEGIEEEPETVPETGETESSAEGKKILVMIPADRMGHGDDELGRKLMINFIKTLKETGPELWRLVFVNSGVRLCVSGSPVLEDLADLMEKGISILVCGTCLTHFDLLEKKELGETTNMLDIVTSIQVADQVVNI